MPPGGSSREPEPETPSSSDVCSEATQTYERPWLRARWHQCAANEDNGLDGDTQRALRLLSQVSSPDVLLPTSAPAASRVPPQPSARGTALSKRGPVSVAGSQLGGIGPAAARSSLFVAQQAQGRARKMREAKAKATARSHDIEELTTARFQ
eukprot:4235069-Amphidinium_carterae.1